MAKTTHDADALARWRGIVDRVHAALAGSPELDRAAGDGSMTLREHVHHIVEANVVAASIVVAALGSPGTTYDWSWMLPFGPWMERLRYDTKPIEPALRLLEALNAWVAAQIEAAPVVLGNEIRLRDQPGGELRTVTLADVLRQEADHAEHHLAAK